MPDLSHILEEISVLPGDWHDSGTLTREVVVKLARVIDQEFPDGLKTSAETGCGKSTLLLSHLSQSHYCFTLGIGDSADKVRAHPTFRPGHVHFVFGPSQMTLRHHEWKQKLDLALIDGAHGYPFPELDYYFFYPQLNPGAILIVDDIHIPTITNLYRFLREDEMFDLIAVEMYTAFFRRTAEPAFDPMGDGWERQKYNQARFPHKDWLVPVLGDKWWLK